MIEHETLTESQKRKIIDIVGKCYTCGKEGTHKELGMHRIRRGYEGGKYTLKNCDILCKEHHDERHANEIMGRRG